jgi:hypothetical protein
MTLPIAFEVTGEPCSAVVEALANALAEARAGRITMVAIACVADDGKGFHTIGWGPGHNPLTLVGACERAKACVLREFDK